MNTQTQDNGLSDAERLMTQEPQWAEVQSSVIPSEELEAWREEMQEPPSFWECMWNRSLGRYAGR